MYRYLCHLCDGTFCSDLTIDQLPEINGDIVCTECNSEHWVTDCDYCGEMALCHNDNGGGTRCNSCKEKQR